MSVSTMASPKKRIHFPLPRHTKTKFIAFNPGVCEACWSCVNNCPRGVFGKLIVMSHRHAHVDKAKACQGCLKCIKVCPEGAIRARVEKYIKDRNHGNCSTKV